MALAKKKFYNRKIHPHKDLNRANARFFEDIGTQNEMSRNALIVKTKEKSEKC